jgi:hypothetical protein
MGSRIRQDCVLVAREDLAGEQGSGDVRPQGRRILGWSEWTGGDHLRHAMLVLDDGSRLQIHEQR